MGLLKELSKENKTVSIVGMAKNAGKTTALNHLIEEGYKEGILLGVTSTGRDGESVDLVTETEKPRVYLYEGTLVTVPEKLFALAEAALEIISTSKYSTGLGALYLCRVREGGFVQIAGPVASSDTKKICDEMLSLGVDMVLVDGAIDRKSVANPQSSDSVILSTGAVISRDIKKVVADTAHVVELYNLPEIEEGTLRSLIEERTEDAILLVKEDNETESLDLMTGLGSGRHINQAIDDNTKYVYIPGALTVSMLEEIDFDKLKRIEFIIKDPTRIFVDTLSWKQFKKRGLKVKVLKNIKVSAVTVNPTSPEGYSFNSQILCDKLEEELGNIPVIDVRK